MRKILLLAALALVGLRSVPAFAEAPTTTEHLVAEAAPADRADAHNDAQAGAHGEDAHADEHHSEGPAAWAVIPFVLLLVMIATGPLFFGHFWHKNYPIVAVLLAVVVVSYYLFSLHNSGAPIHALAEYIQFIALLSSLFMASGGILIKVDKEGTPAVNVMLLLIGALSANIIGTTGASMLLIRPFIRLNKNRIRSYHVVFFIFIVSNVGGALTPIGDPPLFLGFLKGVPFEWTLTHNIFPWAFVIAALLVIFFVMDKRNKADYDGPAVQEKYSGKISIIGGKNFLWLAVIIIAVFIDPNVIDGIPYIPFESHGTIHKISYLRELIMFSVAGFSYAFASKEALRGNEFSFEPIKEVAFIFIGIFMTMIPALELVGAFAKGEGAAYINPASLYWGTGILSSFLDNAPTYVNFLTAAMASQGGDVYSIEQVRQFAAGQGIFANHHAPLDLEAISIAAVFFGAMTYIGNGPNFMVKAIAEQVGVSMPSFFAYILRYAVVILLPILLVVWLIFVFGGVWEMIYGA